MTRAEELRAAGATVLADKSGSTGDRLGPTPFIKWPSTAPPTAWVEGTVAEIWEGKYGHNATIIATGCSEGLTAGGGDTVAYPVEGNAGQKFNVGLSSATLKDRVTEEHIGEVLHFEFLGWVESANGGNRYRQFEIQVVPEELRRPTVVYPEIVGSVAHGVTEDGDPEVIEYTEDKLPF